MARNEFVLFFLRVSGRGNRSAGFAFLLPALRTVA